MLRLCTECYVKRVHLQAVHLVAIRKIAYVEDDRLKRDVFSVSSGLDARSSVELVSVFMAYIPSAALVPQLQ
jgi:hypothetical protein